MGAQITLLRGNDSVPHPLLLRNVAAPTRSVVNYVLQPCTLIACKCTLSAVRVGGQCFSVLRTSHIDVVGDSSGRSYVT